MARLEIGDQKVLEVLNDIKSSQSQINWGVFGYVPRTSSLQVVSSGEGGWNEMIEEMSDGKVLFGYASFKVSEVFKYVFLVWCSEGVSAMAKGTFQRHTGDFENFLKSNGFGYHVQINARNENDLEEKDVVEKLNRARGANFVQAKTSVQMKQAPQRALRDDRASFWGKQSEVDKNVANQMSAHNKAKEESLLRTREAEAQRISNQANRLNQEVNAKRESEVANRRAEQETRTNVEKAKWESQSKNLQNQVENKYNSAARAEYGTAMKSSAPAPAHNTYQAPQYDDYNTQSTTSTKTAVNIPSGAAGNLRNKFEQLAQAPAQPAVPSKPVAPAAKKAAPPPPAARVPEPVYTPEPEPEPEQYYDDSHHQDYQQEQHEQQYEQQQQDDYYQEEQHQQYEDQGYDTGNGNQYPLAKAVYDYAGEEGDLSFNEGDIISVIDTSDPGGWWQGELNGAVGVFPSNFVEMIQ
eukprot:TRINITY_DN368_c0_g1_i2.p1 TRINITY_DN368_c0_g1~~TRINITY_DN368_c0_g1_i2.p1  ORF type:complete len:466 (-),score=291.80 TRINITY_DN368_c0_g1_i2:170-1567(-)